MEKAKIEITVTQDKVHVKTRGDDFTVMDGLLVALVRRARDARLPGVTNEDIANHIRTEVLETLEEWEKKEERTTL